MKAAPITEIAEEIIDDLADWAADKIEMVLAVVTPGGEMWGMEKRTEAESLQAYIDEGLHDSPDACLNWIRKRVTQWTQELAQKGIPQEELAAYHLYDIAQKQLVAVSAKYERLMEEKQEDAPSPSSPFMTTEMIDGGPV